MIDCSKTENYFAEKRRMTKKHKLNGGAYIYIYIYANLIVLNVL